MFENHARIIFEKNNENKLESMRITTKIPLKHSWKHRWKFYFSLTIKTQQI